MPRLIRKAVERTSAREDAGSIGSGVDVIGDIAVVRLAGVSLAKKREIGAALIEELGNVRSVYEQEGGIEGEFRLRRLNHLAGEEGTETTHRENGCTFRLDLRTCYFSPRLSTERLRIASSTRRGESVLNMFAGVGPFSIPIAKKAGAKVTSCDLNDQACRYHVVNNAANKVERQVAVVNADAGELPRLLSDRFDRIIMPHPSDAARYVPAALAMAAKGATIHYYRHLSAENEVDAAKALRNELAALLPADAKYEMRRVRVVGPRWVEMAADITLSD